MYLEQLWEAIAARPERPVFRRVDETHPLDLYVGLSASSEQELLLLTDIEPPVPSGHPRGLRIEHGRRTDGRWALTVRLVYAELGRLFAHLCEDLVAACRSGCRPADAGRFVIDRIERWERLLSRGRRNGLDETTYRGLVAELEVLRRWVLPHAGPDAGIASWVGPLQADQDFRLADRLIEVKSLAVGALSVTISSAGQLEAHGAPLFLAAVPITTGAGATDTTLLDIVESVRQGLHGHTGSLTTFEERLAMTDYADNDPLASRTVGIGVLHAWHVRDDFPRIVRSSMPAAIRSVKYQLDLAACSHFRISDIFGI